MHAMQAGRQAGRHACMHAQRQTPLHRQEHSQMHRPRAANSLGKCRARYMWQKKRYSALEIVSGAL
eukprot:1045331-Alexandrium_andersonii.AAC.1